MILKLVLVIQFREKQSIHEFTLFNSQFNSEKNIFYDSVNLVSCVSCCLSLARKTLKHYNDTSSLELGHQAGIT